MPDTLPEGARSADARRAPAASSPSSLVPGHVGPVRVLVVGASEGIGLALARRLAAHEGVSRLFLASRHAPRSEALRALLPAFPGRVELLACDLTHEPSLGRLGAAIGSAGAD